MISLYEITHYEHQRLVSSTIEPLSDTDLVCICIDALDILLGTALKLSVCSCTVICNDNMNMVPYIEHHLTIWHVLPCQ